MSMHYLVKAYRPPDEKWREMKEAFDACKAVGVDPPKEVWEFFDGEIPNPAGVEIEIQHSDYYGEDEGGIEIHTEDIPEGCKSIRFIVGC